MNFRALALGTVIGFVVAFAPSCGGGSKCGPNNCNGCCKSDGTCVAKPDNSLNTTCGSAGNACADCAATAQVCNAATNTCGNIGGGGGAGGGTGGGSGGGGGGSTCTGCLLPGCTPTATNNCCAPGTTTNNCGSGGNACMTCPTGQLCTNQQCQTPQVMKKIGDACSTNADCASVGAGAICKTMTSSGNASYTGGYCTIPCTQFGNDPVCGTTAFCVGLNPRYGEDDVFCWDRCSNGDPCRTPGYGCYNLGSGFAGCWLNPLPQQDAGPPADKIGNDCTMDTQCQNPPDNGGICLTRDDTLGLVFPNGYCSKDFCDSDEECGADGGGSCVSFGSGDTRCMRHCLQGGTTADAGQSDCKTGYLCLSLGTADGGRTTDGVCIPPAPPPPTSVGQACANNAACEQPAGTIADCITETVTLSDGGTTLTGYPGGYCSRFNCQGDSECGPTNSGVCLQITSNPQAAIQTACFQACAAPGGGQSTCRSGYICTSIGLADGGSAPTGYCDARCDAPGNGCGTGRTCNTTTGYCQ